MNDVLKYKNFNELNISYLKEHDKFIKKHSIEFIFLNGVKLPLIYIYEIIDELFKNNSIILKKSEIILLTITTLASMSKEDKFKINDLILELEKNKLIKHLKYVRYSMNSLKNLINIVLKNEIVIINIEQAIKYNGSLKILFSVLNIIIQNKIGIKTFYDWFIVANRKLEANSMLSQVSVEYHES